MTVDAVWLTPDDPRWPSVLARVDHDAYHLPGYVQAAAWQEEGCAAAFWSRGAGGELFVPLILRPVPQRGDWHDAVSPYGYPGPLWLGDPAADQRPHWQAFADAGRARRLVSVFFRLHPFLPSAADPQQMPGTQVVHGDIYVVDLRQPHEDYQRQVRKSHRRSVRRLQAEGFRVEHNTWEHFPGFTELYDRSMQRLGASRYYQLRPEYFAALRRELPQHLHLLSAFDPRGRLAAAGLLLSCGGAVHCHLGGVGEDFLLNNPTRLIDMQTVELFREQGYALLNLGGGLGGEDDSLAQYKRGFATTTFPYATCRLVLDEAAYTHLSGGQTDTPFFPAYRQRGAGLAALTAD